MNKRVVWALLLIVILILVLIFNRGSVGVDLLAFEVSGMKALIFLAFTAWGVAIGLLIR